mgnify:CR=1 FL=1
MSEPKYIEAPNLYPDMDPIKAWGPSNGEGTAPEQAECPPLPEDFELLVAMKKVRGKGEALRRKKTLVHKAFELFPLLAKQWLYHRARRVLGMLQEAIRHRVPG